AFESKGGFLRILNISDNERPLTNFGNRLLLIKGNYDGVPDTKVTINGTLSFTNNSLDNSNSVVMVLKDAGIYDKYEAFFNQLKSLPEFRSSGSIYAGFPETFEPVDPADINKHWGPDPKVLALPTGNWLIDKKGGLRNVATVDKIVSGTHAFRSGFNVDHPIYFGMDFDVPDGASKVSFYYGTWGNESAPQQGETCMFRLEYSTDQGVSWTVVPNSTVTDPAWVAKQLSYDVDIDGPVRFRINRMGAAPNGDDGRLNIDDFAVYKKR